MRKTAYLASGIVLGACFLAVPREAHALGPVDIEGGGLIGFTSNPSHGPNPFGVGIGARAGVGYRGLYLGLALTYYFGASGECGGGAPVSPGTSQLGPAFCSVADGGGEVELQQSTSLYGLDIGYTFGFASAKWFKLRPILQIGDAQITRTGSVSSQEVNGIAGLSGDNRFYLQPGLTALVVVESFFAGIDANLLVVPGVTDPEGVVENVSGTGTLTSSTRALLAFTGHLQVGFRF
jgi:hypothetical protein